MTHTKPSPALEPRSKPDRAFAPILLALASFLGLAPGTAFAQGTGCNDGFASSFASYACAAAGDLLEVRLGDLRPTQAVLGHYEVYYKLGRYQAGKDSINKRFDDWCEANGQEKALSATSSSRLDDSRTFTCTVPVGKETNATVDPMKTAVIGPGSVPYLVDGHHTFTAFIESPDGGPNTRVRVRILANLANVEPRNFWTVMSASGWAWLRDRNDRPITAWQLPDFLALSRFENDDYRGLIYFTRDIAYSQNSRNANYQEFHWGRWLRGNKTFNLASYDLTDRNRYVAAIDATGHLMSGLSDGSVVDAPFTSGNLGRIDFNTGEFGKASLDYCNAKPGKIAYALYYYHNILNNPPKVTCP